MGPLKALEKCTLIKQMILNAQPVGNSESWVFTRLQALCRVLYDEYFIDLQSHTASG